MKLVGRLAGVRDGKVQFSGSLRNLCELADLKLNRLLNTMDDWAAENGVSDAVGPPHRPEPTRVEASPPLGLDLGRAGIRTIVWATGCRLPPFVALPRIHKINLMLKNDRFPTAAPAGASPC